MWGETAERITETLTRGDRVVVLGRAGTRTWTPPDGANAGQEQRRLDVVADEIGPSLRWATATLTKTTRPGTSDAEQASAQVGEDEPPF